MRKEIHRPIADMIERCISDGALRFHMPGHKGLLKLPDARHDVTELPETDELFDPQGGILQAQMEAARCWGAAGSFLLVNGSTAGIQAMILWAKSAGYQLFLPRDCHISAVYACALADIQPRWLMPLWNEREQLNIWNEADALHPAEDKVAIIPTYPDYYGRCLDLARVKQKHQIDSNIILTDAAHGSHFIFSERLPEDAGFYSDLWVTGVHKTLPAPTQTAFLHVKEAGNVAEVGRMLRAVTTTSPSFLLMEGADNSRAILQENIDKLEILIDSCLNFAKRVNKLAGLHCWTEGDVTAMGYARYDPTRLVVDVQGLGITGWEACRRLAGYGVRAEMGDIFRVVLIATIMDNGQRLDQLYRAFARLAADRAGCGDTISHGLGRPVSGQRAMTIRQAWLSRAEELPFEQCVDRIAAEPFGAYPPGTALCMPGERISPEVVEMVKHALALGGSLYGCRKGRLAVIIEK